MAVKLVSKPTVFAQIKVFMVGTQDKNILYPVLDYQFSKASN